MELADLKHWTPIRLILQPPDVAVEWCDLTGLRFEEPFFDQTIQRWAATRPVLRTGLQELVALDAEPSLNPSGFIFHLSRCGSTLLSRLLSTLPGLIVAAEPAPINTLLEADSSLVHEAARVAVLRLLIRALGRIRFGDETGYVVKLSSWNVRLAPLIRAAFPDTPWVWVQRRPEAILASILAGPPGWMRLREHPHRAAALFGLDPAQIPSLDPAEFCARVLAAMLEAWLGAPKDNALILDYRDLPEAAWASAAPFLGLAVEAPDIEHMAHEARYYAKDPGKRVFTADAGAVPPALQDLASRLIDPLYARVAGSAPGSSA